MQTDISTVKKQQGQAEEETDLIVSAHINQDWQTVVGLDAGAGRVQGQFTNRDPHSIGSEVAETQDPLPICHHNSLQK